MSANLLRADARAIWDAAVAAVWPDDLVRAALTKPGVLSAAVTSAWRIIVVGGGKAGTGMAAGMEAALAGMIERVSGLVNVPAGTERPLRAVRLHAARPAGSNEPTVAGVVGTDEMLRLVAGAGPGDVVVCLLSGGGSAIMPAPAEGITLDHKQIVTRQLHACGATIGEMNAVRKHLSRFKGGGLVRASAAGRLFGLIISDVVGDPLDVIASGPTAPDPTTFADTLAILGRYGLLSGIPPAVRARLESGAAGNLPETLKELPPAVQNLVLGNNALALAAAKTRAEMLGYRVVDLGPNVEGETRDVAVDVIAKAVSVVADDGPLVEPVCVLVGGETTVTLAPGHGKGGRNTEFVLAALIEFGRMKIKNAVVLSGGTDGEDGPTDAAGAVGDQTTLDRARKSGMDVADFLRRHDSYTFFEATGDLVKTGLTGTNVMDVRVVLIGPPT